MFVRTKNTPNSPKTAVQLVENIRTGKTIKQKVIRHFGYALNPDEIIALKKIALRYKLELEEKSQPKLFSTNTLLSLIEIGQKQSVENNKPIPVDLNDLKEQKRVCLGIHQCYGGLFDQIGFNQVIKNSSRKEATVNLLRNIVMARISNPASKRKSIMMLEQEYGVSINLSAVYRMMDLLDDAAINRTNQLSYQYTKSLLEEKVNIIFYDCTTLYFESFTEDELKQNGYSKDGKFNQSQVLLAMMVTQAGLPIGYQLYEGHKFEGHTLDNALTQLHKDYKINQLIFAADSALLSGENIERFRQKQQPFIVGARIKNLSKELTKKILDSSGYKNLFETEDQTEEAITYQEIKIEDDLRLIVSYSPKRAAKDKYDREKAIESLKKKISKSKNPTSLLNNFGYKKYVKLEGEAKLVTDQQKIKQAEKWDGLHGILTNTSTKQQSVMTIYQHYKGLWQIEETFRISKHDLKMRPIFHWTPRRIKSHIAICFMALVCMRIMEYKVNLQYKKLSPAAIRNELLRLQTSILKDQKTHKEYGIPSRASQDAKKIYQLLGLKWSDTPFVIK